jgi:type I restriction enzyme S subunit
MKSSDMKNVPWVKLEDYIEVSDERNTNNVFMLDDVRGISINKAFITTKADMVGVSLLPYKVVKSYWFCYVTVTSRNGGRISLALNTDSKSAIVSSSYIVFRLKNEKNLLPKYLNLFFNRSEFDRYARFNSWGSARETFDFSEMNRVKIPLPSIEVQRSLVAVYERLEKLVADNEALIEQLEKVCHDFVVDCKSKYPKVKLGDYIEESDERNSNNELTLESLKGISTEKKFIETKANMDGVSLSSYKIVHPREFAYVADTSRRGDKIALAINNENKAVLISSIYSVFRSQDEDILLPEYLNLLFNRSEFDRYARFNSWGSARETFDFSEMCRVEIPLPPIEIQKSIAAVVHCLQESRRIVHESRELMKNICPALVQKAAHSA